MDQDWTTVVPAKGRIRDVARELLALANDPADVVSQRGGTEFRIPPYLADRYSKPPAPKRRRSPKEEGEE